ncbi:uncharacterized protein LOC123004461 [Tribolium madens]|uniref:uncharacterized protein LOC123004461 n=1 Tax=Tribolium madens TaxID=41895 RepID=UPI001CF73B89|nr:uncharacterized protein LOC123004461 [Tribolium madens]
MLVATPYREFDGPPRVISEVRKSYASKWIDFKPKLAGDLLVRTGNDKKWWPRRAVVRNGQLQISAIEDAPNVRLPLRHLSLQAGALPNSLSLCKGEDVVLTIQTADERSFEIWVKTIAIELIRQTPLEDVKYLDIFTLASYWGRKTSKDCNSNYIEPPVENPCAVCVTNIEEKNIENLLKKCQNAESYVPVKEKLILFESLCKLGRKVRSTEDVSCKAASGTKRARSMHDLSNFSPQSAVREICKYFEIKSEASVEKYGTIARFNRSDSQLTDKKPF